ncbi:hypothetical protein D7X74_30435 [Corallococcus sp. CA047B]|uniref:hypothetical protein n=1 Tax=Corallococcus sp. CA047B TaxID=2316729 RepID=UPI000EA1C625|nr:hypothetical protein [Corallococcus sp. CA047B]RKH09003.1 hypothetical protein D7X74_30435 [Corallococcus sp. CA047B]
MRRRFVYRTNPETGQVESHEVSADYQSVEARAPLFTDRFMEGAQAQDGTDISSRTKRRDYMRAHNLADTSDFTGTLEAATKERARFYDADSKHDTQARREAVARAMEGRRGR